MATIESTYSGSIEGHFTELLTQGLYCAVRVTMITCLTYAIVNQGIRKGHVFHGVLLLNLRQNRLKTGFVNIL